MLPATGSVVNSFVVALAIVLIFGGLVVLRANLVVPAVAPYRLEED